MFKIIGLKLFAVDLTLFDDGGGAASSGSGDAGSSQGGSVSTSQSTPAGKKTSGEPVVLYGKQPDDGAQATDTGKEPDAAVQKTPEQRKAEYEAFRKGEYKDLFDSDVQNIINRRFRETKVLESQLTAMNPIVEILSEKYGTSDMKELAEKVREDNLIDLADASGMTVEQYESVMKIRKENRELRERQKTIEAEQRANEQVARWSQESDQVKAMYPNFDLRTELQNERFMGLLKSGVDVKAAYEVIHMPEIMAGTARQAQNNMAENIKAKGQRPVEGAAKGTPGVVIKSDPSKLTREDRARIADMVRRGEKITF